MLNIGVVHTHVFIQLNVGKQYQIHSCLLGIVLLHLIE